MDENKGSAVRLLLGGLLIIVGLLLFFSINDMLPFDVGHIIFSWPFVMFAVGLLVLINSKNRTFGIILVLIGGFFLIPRIFPDVYFEGSLVFPLIIIGIGIAIIVRHRQPEKRIIPGVSSDREVKKDFVDDVAVFGGGDKTFISDNFRGGSITAIFGGSEIDLTQCRLAEGENVLDVLMIFGGSDIYVPKDWHVIVNVTPLFGGFSHKVMRDPSLPIDKTRVLMVKGLALFGGGEIKSRF